MQWRALRCSRCGFDGTADGTGAGTVFVCGSEIWKSSPEKSFCLSGQGRLIWTTKIPRCWRIRLETHSNAEVRAHENAEGRKRRARLELQAIVFLGGWAGAQDLRAPQDPRALRSPGARGAAARNQDRTGTVVVRGGVGAAFGRGHGACWRFLRAHLPHTQRYARGRARHRLSEISSSTVWRNIPEENNAVLMDSIYLIDMLMKENKP